jgi:hypothetical protein
MSAASAYRDADFSVSLDSDVILRNAADAS